jgi:hypothetical protein
MDSALIYTRDGVIQAVYASFSSGEHAAVIAALDRYGTATHEIERDRVQFAIVVLSQGNFERLANLVDCAKLDYRDILAWHQLGPMSAVAGARLQQQTKDLILKWGDR